VQTFIQPTQPEEKKPEKKEYNFWDDLGAWFTSPAEGSIFTTPIAGAAQKKEDEQNLWNSVMGEGNLTPEGGIKIPTNEQLKQLGREDEVINVDGDLRPVTNSPFENVANREAAAAADAINAREGFTDSLYNFEGPRQVRELTPEEWAGLSPEQQKGVIATYALYEASLADRTAEGKADEDYNQAVLDIFGEGGGSDTYMPNTIKVLQDLGYNTETGDLDNFRTTNAIADYRDILGSGGLKGEGQRLEVFNDLAASPAFNDESVQVSLEAGASLLDSLRNSGSFAPSVFEFGGLSTPVTELGAEDQDYLMTMLKGLASRDIWARLSEEQNLNDEVTADLQAARDKYGDDVISTFFLNNISGFTNNTDFMTPEEFRTNWIGG